LKKDFRARAAQKSEDDFRARVFVGRIFSAAVKRDVADHRRVDDDDFAVDLFEFRRDFRFVSFHGDAADYSQNRQRKRFEGKSRIYAARNNRRTLGRMPE